MNALDVIIALVDLAGDCDNEAEFRARTGGSGPEVKRWRDRATASTQAALWLTALVGQTRQVPSSGDKTTPALR